MLWVCKLPVAYVVKGTNAVFVSIFFFFLAFSFRFFFSLYSNKSALCCPPLFIVLFFSLSLKCPIIMLKTNCMTDNLLSKISLVINKSNSYMTYI